MVVIFCVFIVIMKLRYVLLKFLLSKWRFVWVMRLLIIGILDVMIDVRFLMVFWNCRRCLKYLDCMWKIFFCWLLEVVIMVSVKYFKVWLFWFKLVCWFVLLMVFWKIFCFCFEFKVLSVKFIVLGFILVIFWNFDVVVLILFSFVYISLFWFRIDIFLG